MPMMTWLSMHSYKLESWQAYILLAVAILGIIAIATVVYKTRDKK